MLARVVIAVVIGFVGCKWDKPSASECSDLQNHSTRWKTLITKFCSVPTAALSLRGRHTRPVRLREGRHDARSRR